MHREEELLVEEVDLLFGVVHLTLVGPNVDTEVELQLVLQAEGLVGATNNRNFLILFGRFLGFLWYLIGLDARKLSLKSSLNDVAITGA